MWPNLSHNKNAKNINKNTYIKVTNIRNICIRKTYIKVICIKDAFFTINVSFKVVNPKIISIKDINIQNIYIRSISITIASGISAIKILKIYL